MSGREGEKVGDTRRFDVMADLVAERFPGHRSARVVDVAGGRGGLQAALRQRGFTCVTSVDVRAQYAKGRKGYRYGLFTSDYAENFDLVVAMHPDDATDHAILYAVKRDLPFVVCPCCVRPSADHNYKAGKNDYWRWADHLRLLGGGKSKVETLTLPMSGRNLVLLADASARSGKQ
jgi:hypothetical protein